MGDAAPKEPSMEDILSSIRKIVTQEDKEDAGGKRAGDAEQPPRAQMPAGEKSGSRAEGAGHDETKADKSAKGGSLADLASQVKQQMPERPAQPAGQPMPEPRPPMQAAAEPRQAAVARNTPDVSSEDDTAVEEGAEKAEAATPPPSPVAEAPRGEPPVRAGQDAARQDGEADAFREALVAPATQKAVTSAFDRLKRNTLQQIDAKVEAILARQISEWLDENLPPMVERVVREEVERIAAIDEDTLFGES